MSGFVAVANWDYLSTLSFARQMRGGVSEWSEDYIEKYIPSYILEKMFKSETWTDEGFEWGFRYVFAAKLKESNENVVIVASRSYGMGCCDLKAIMPNMSIIEISNFDIALETINCVTVDFTI